MSGWWTCRVCGGSGDLPNLACKCPLCHGDGTVDTMMAAMQESFATDLIKFRTQWPFVVAFTGLFWVSAMGIGLLAYTHYAIREEQRLLRETAAAAKQLAEELKHGKAPEELLP